jgi:hypothetical protein
MLYFLGYTSRERIPDHILVKLVKESPFQGITFLSYKHKLSFDSSESALSQGVIQAVKSYIFQKGYYLFDTLATVDNAFTILNGTLSVVRQEGLWRAFFTENPIVFSEGNTPEEAIGLFFMEHQHAL